MHIAITGCTGTLGKALLKHYLSIDQTPDFKILGLSRDELKQHELREELKREFPQTYHRLTLQLADVRDGARLLMMFHKVNIVIHAAALKRVDSVSYSPEEVIKTNVLGTMNVLAAAHGCGVRQVLFVSTDKAVEPINIYGASKMMAENCVTSYNQYCYPDMQTSVARYGNVWGSRGSFIKEWRRAFKENKPIPITHKDMTRFVWMPEQAVRFIDICLQHMEGGEIFVPWCPAVLIHDVFLAWQRKLGMSHIRPEYIGLRPGGEKIHETLIAEHELARTAGFSHVDFYDKYTQQVHVILPYLYPWRKDWSYDNVGEVLKEPFCSDEWHVDYAFTKDFDNEVTKLAEKIF